MTTTPSRRSKRLVVDPDWTAHNNLADRLKESGIEALVAYDPGGHKCLEVWLPNSDLLIITTDKSSPRYDHWYSVAFDVAGLVLVTDPLVYHQSTDSLISWLQQRCSFTRRTVDLCS